MQSFHKKNKIKHSYTRYELSVKTRMAKLLMQTGLPEYDPMQLSCHANRTGRGKDINIPRQTFHVN